MSKAARIRELYAHGFSPREIAEMVGCRVEYVRVAARQRIEGKPSRAEFTYMKSKGCSTMHELKMLTAARKYRMDDMHAAWSRRQREYNAKKRAQSA